MVQNEIKVDVLAIRNAKLAGDYALWEGSGFYVAPPGTLNTNDKKTKFTGTTDEKTPVASGAERMKGKGEISNLTKNRDVQDHNDFSETEIHRGYGNKNFSAQLLFPQVKNARFEELGKRFHVASEYTEFSDDPIVYDIFLIYGPDVEHLGMNTADKVRVLRRVTFGDEEERLQAGGNMLQMAINFESELRYNHGYTFKSVLRTDATIVADTDYNPDNQIKIPARAALTVSGATGFGNITIKGLDDETGCPLTEVVPFTANGTVYTKNIFRRIFDDADGDTEKGIQVGTGWVAASLEVKADELVHSND